MPPAQKHLRSPNIEQKQCEICSDKMPPFSAVITHSLFGKYSSSQNFYYTKDVEAILCEELCQNFIQFQENKHIDDDEQYLKRQYGLGEFPKKVEMLSQYYKFHRNHPTWTDRGVQPMMTKYYNKVKDVDYKMIKSVLKKQQNIQLSTHKSFSSDEDSEFTKKSKYSLMLNQLNTQPNQSIILLEICDKIDRALKKVNTEPFKGNYYSGEKRFEEFLKKEKRRKDVGLKKQQTRQNTFHLKKFNFNKNLQTKNDQNSAKQSKFASSNSIESKNMFRYQKYSREKTDNDTASRQEISRKEKSGINMKPIREFLSKKILRDNFTSQIAPSSGRQLTTINCGNTVHANSLKTINKVYQTTVATHGDSKKIIRPTSSNKMKYRSNSTHNLQTDKRNSQNKVVINQKDGVYTNRLLRTNSNKKIPTSTTFTSKINLLKHGNSTQKSQMRERQISQRILRANSVKKLTYNQNKANENINNLNIRKKIAPQLTERINQRGNTERGSTERGIKCQRNSVVENMLQKKLELFKKKQVII